jgi:ABC-type phosphate/phosphonate transport system substrate-binding protein
MKNRNLLVVLILLSELQPIRAAGPDSAAPTRVRIGVDIRLGFQSCMNSWLPVAEYLSKAIPDHRFVVVPLASQQDVTRTLEKGDVEFAVLDPALEIVAHDRYGAAPLLTVVETLQGETQPRPANASCSGTLIRRADRADLRRIQDLRGQRLSAVKPWSLPGWIAPWGLLVKNGIDPHTALKQVVFEGTNGQVVKSVVDGAADVGAVDTDMLLHLIRSHQVPDESLCFFNREGRAVPLVGSGNTSSTDAYPNRVLSKTQATSDELAQRVVEALLKQSVAISVDQIPYRIGWSIAGNHGKVRRLLQDLMGPQYAESPGFPLPRRYPAWFFPAAIVAAALAAFAAGFLFLRRRYRRREHLLGEQLEDTRQELIEVRAEGQRISAILALAGCGIDIIDGENQIVYADSSFEREYGDWHGRKCHEYFCGSNAPCECCRRSLPISEQCATTLDLDRSEWTACDRAHARAHHIKGESTRMIGIPFYDEKGRWLYARIHMPMEALSAISNS